MDVDLLKQVSIPVVAFGLGAVLLQNEKTEVPGKLAMFFGSQTVMNIYMKQVLSGTVVAEENGEELKGIPSAFLVTAMQQMVAFLLFGVFILVSRLTSKPYMPKQLTTGMEWLAVLLFSFSFTMNIAMNNFSISLLPLSINLIIRSCLPLATFLSQRVASTCTGESVQPCNGQLALELGLMLLGVACAGVAVMAKSQSGGDESKTLVFGIFVCVLSLFSGAINLALAGVLGTSVKLNSLDTTVYMSIPAFLFLMLPSFLYRHPIGWKGYGDVTDWQVLQVVMDKKPTAVLLALFSGVLALFYNVLQYGIVQSLSASYTAFAGNFNKAATIAIGLIMGLESLPEGVWAWVLILAVIGNIAAFTAFNVVKIRAKEAEEKRKKEAESAELLEKADPEKRALGA